MHRSIARQLTKRMAAPRYSLNPHLSEACPEPPVPLARAWAASYPSASSPFASSGSSSTSSPSQPLLNLAQGVPGHAPHASLIERMAQESRRLPMETHGYGPVFGDASLREALSQDLTSIYGVEVKSDHIACTAGCNMAASVVFHALAQPGEAIVLPTPWYFNHQMTLASLAIEAVPLSTQSPSFLPSPGGFEDLVKRHNKEGSKLARIKAVVLVTPNNPTGSIYPPALLNDFYEVCAREGIAMIVDETYRDFLLEEETSTSDKDGLRPLARPHELFLKPDWASTVLSLHSFSKSYAIPGHRLGAIVGHPSLLISQSPGPRATFGSLAKSLDNIQICPPRSDTQRAVAWAMSDPEQRRWRLTVANDLARRRQKFAAGLEAKVSIEDIERLLPASQGRNVEVSASLQRLLEGNVKKSAADLGWKLQSAGGYYAFMAHPFASKPSQEICTALASLVGIVTLPGSFFRPAEDAPTDRDIRVSIANVDESLLETLPARLVLFTALWQ